MIKIEKFSLYMKPFCHDISNDGREAFECNLLRIECATYLIIPRYLGYSPNVSECSFMISTTLRSIPSLSIPTILSSVSVTKSTRGIQE